MNSYNENLRSTVISSLQSQELEQKKEKAKKNASMFTLYYAEGATITALEKLQAANNVLGTKTDAKKQAVISSNISNNLLSSATQANQYLKQSVSNTAVCAANVQVAATSIVRLASDLGSIYGIVNAADFDSDIYKQTDEVRQLMDITAYEAEQTSQYAMEVSMATSEVSSSTVLDKAKVTNDAMNNVLKIASDEFTAASTLAASDNASLASISASEKLAEGNFEDIAVDYKASEDAYTSTNRELNLNLSVPKKKLTPISFNVQFNPIKTPFGREKIPFYPVSGYSIIVVKDAKKTVFSMSNAEALLSDPDSKSIVPVVLPGQDAKSGSGKPSPLHAKINQQINFQTMIDKEGNTYVLQDSDGEDIELGKRYVVFLMATYQEDYKKKINDFSDFLSAPSPSFILANKLKAVDGATIKITSTAEYDVKIDVTKPGKKVDIHEGASPQIINYNLTFQVAENPEYADKVNYRCIFLPKNDELGQNLLSKESFDEFNHEVAELEAIADKFDPKIAELEASIDNMQSAIEGLIARQTALVADSSVIKKDQAYNAKEKAQLVEKNKKLQSDTANEIAEKTKQVNAQKTKLADLQKEKNKEISAIEKVVQSRLGFLFNLKIAEQVTAGNYIDATKSVQPKDAKKPKAGTGQDDDHYPSTGWTVEIAAGVTDNFGNPLIEDSTYIPVILSYCTAKEDEIALFTNNWSGYHRSPLFTYKLNENPNPKK
ncbi:MAG TPA: hypothetical protein VNY73_04355 [Bacteroidia bacterium]|jgi:hypothetical protein|nr:hypothetical protein [Bacteroidia bacterium]